MLAYAARRFVGAVPTLLVLVTLAFVLVRLAPGGPFDAERPLPPAVEAELRAQYHLNEPLWRQYLRYLGNVAQLDFGPSFQYRDLSVNRLIATGLPISLALGGLAMLLALLVGVPLGTAAALRRNGVLDHALMGVAMAGISIPNFVLAPLLILAFAVHLDWLPAGGLFSWQGLVLPVLALAAPQVAYVARLTRTGMADALATDFVRAARAKGLPARNVVWRHALPAALTPVVSYLGPATAAILTGSVVIETIFGIPGLGRYFVQGALNRDYTLVLGVVIVYGALVVLCNLVVDLLYAWLDPRIQL